MAKSDLTHPQPSEKAILGFWIYLMTDLLMFAVLFACYAVLRDSTFGGPGPKELFNLPLALTETLLLLTSSFTCGVGMVYARKGDRNKTIALFLLTLILGLAFLGFEISEFSQLAREGHTPQSSAFLTSFFSLVGMHGLHITAGLLWITILILYMLKRGLTNGAVQKLTLLSLFWHFLDIVWIFIFTIVYLLGKV
jgi:cytochrome o ubiquinol oxidase subunit 3